MQEQRLFDQAYDCNQLMILERLKNLELAQIMLQRQSKNDVKAFNKALVYSLNRFYHYLISFRVNRLIKNDVNRTLVKHLTLKINNKRSKICTSIKSLQKVQVLLYHNSDHSVHY